MPLDGQSDLSDGLVQQAWYGIDNAVGIGLPPLSDEELPTCGSNHVTSKTCFKKGEVLRSARRLRSELTLFVCRHHRRLQKKKRCLPSELPVNVFQYCIRYLGICAGKGQREDVPRGTRVEHTAATGNAKDNCAEARRLRGYHSSLEE